MMKVIFRKKATQQPLETRHVFLRNRKAKCIYGYLGKLYLRSAADGSDAPKAFIEQLEVDYPSVYYCLTHFDADLTKWRKIDIDCLYDWIESSYMGGRNLSRWWSWKDRRRWQ